jgi:hypothetical protein
MTDKTEEPAQPVNRIPPPDPAQDDFLQAMQIVEHAQEEVLAKGNLGGSERARDPNAGVPAIHEE